MFCFAKTYGVWCKPLSKEGGGGGGGGGQWPTGLAGLAPNHRLSTTTMKNAESLS